MAQTKMEKLLDAGRRAQARLANVRDSAEKSASQVKGTAIGVGSAAMGGYLRGRMEDDQGRWDYFGVEPELGAGLVLAGGSLVGAFGKMSDDVLDAGKGLLGGYAHNWALQRARQTKAEQPAVAGLHSGGYAPPPQYVVGAQVPAYVQPSRGVPVNPTADEELAANLRAGF